MQENALSDPHHLLFKMYLRVKWLLRGVGFKILQKKIGWARWNKRGQGLMVVELRDGCEVYYSLYFLCMFVNFYKKKEQIYSYVIFTHRYLDKFKLIL